LITGSYNITTSAENKKENMYKLDYDFKELSKFISAYKEEWLKSKKVSSPK